MKFQSELQSDIDTANSGSRCVSKLLSYGHISSRQDLQLHASSSQSIYVRILDKKLYIMNIWSLVARRRSLLTAVQRLHGYNVWGNTTLTVNDGKRFFLNVWGLFWKRTLFPKEKLLGSKIIRTWGLYWFGNDHPNNKTAVHSLYGQSSHHVDVSIFSTPYRGVLWNLLIKYHTVDFFELYSGNLIQFKIHALLHVCVIWTHYIPQ